MKKNINLIRKVFFLFYLLTSTVFVLGVGRIENNNHGKISNNIYIQEVSVGKLNIEQATKKVSDIYKLMPIQIKYEGRLWIVKPKDIDLSYNHEAAVLKAYKYTRTEKINDNIKRKINLKFNKLYYINLTAKYNEIKLSKLINNICSEINLMEKEGTFEVTDKSQIIRTESREGKEVDSVKLKEEIYNMLNDNKIKDINLQVKIIRPRISSQDVKSINTVLGQYSTSFNRNSSRGSNIHIASKSTSNILLLPGEEFSYNNATGPRNWINGYKTAKIILGGKFVDGEGGGVCQVSTTIYNAALLSGLDIIEVHNHTYPSKYAPKGRDAAVSYGYTDLKFVNSFAHPVYIKNIVNNGVITSKIYGCIEDRENLYIKIDEKYEKDKIYVKIYRIYFDEENNKIREELVSENKYKVN